MVEKEFRHIVRIFNTDLEGDKILFKGLQKIKGIEMMFANAICYVTGIPKSKKIGELADEEIDKLNESLKNPSKFNIPEWLYNRRKDTEDGTDKHLLASDLTFTQQNDIKNLRKIKCYIGMRHSSGLTVRGQRTKANYRRNKGKFSKR